jgi:hypothetical protein
MKFLVLPTNTGKPENRKAVGKSKAADFQNPSLIS